MHNINYQVINMKKVGCHDQLTQTSGKSIEQRVKLKFVGATYTNV